MGFCRVYLEASAVRVYRQYVDHEEDVRKRLIAYSATGQALTEWKRAFILNSVLRPTRNSVLDLDYMQGTFSDQWYWPRVPHDSPDAIQTNREVVRRFIEAFQFVLDEGHPGRTNAQKHLVAPSIPVESILSDLLLSLRITFFPDSQKLTGLMIQVENYLENHPDAKGCCFVMSQGAIRDRSANPNNEIPTLFQGANPEGENTIYPGDRAIHIADKLTVQIHWLNVTTLNGDISNVPAVAVWVPETMAKGWLVQEPGG
jgi:hypothetical protein